MRPNKKVRSFVVISNNQNQGENNMETRTNSQGEEIMESGVTLTLNGEYYATNGVTELKEKKAKGWVEVKKNKPKKSNKTPSVDAGKYTDKDGIVRWATDRPYTKEERRKQRADFVKDAEDGKQICLTDLMINHGM